LFKAIAKRGKTRTKSELNSAETEGEGVGKWWVCLRVLLRTQAIFVGYLALLEGRVNVLW